MLAALRPLLLGLVVGFVCFVASGFVVALVGVLIRGDTLLLRPDQARAINTLGWVCLLLCMVPAGYVGVAQARGLAARAERLGWGVSGPMALALIVLSVPTEGGRTAWDVLRISTAIIGGAMLGGWWAGRRSAVRRTPR